MTFKTTFVSLTIVVLLFAIGLACKDKPKSRQTQDVKVRLTILKTGLYCFEGSDDLWYYYVPPTDDSKVGYWSKSTVGPKKEDIQETETVVIKENEQGEPVVEEPAETPSNDDGVSLEPDANTPAAPNSITSDDAPAPSADTSISDAGSSSDD